RWADRLSVNVELPSQRELDELAEGKNLVQIEGAMSHVQRSITSREAAGPLAGRGAGNTPWSSATYAAAGQSTQMIVGATAASDRDILGRATALYRDHGLKRVYYSGYSPIPHPSTHLPATAPPLVREHRLYQADWLLRYYGYSYEELFAGAP